MLEPTTYTAFTSEEEKMKYLKDNFGFSMSAMNNILYKGMYSPAVEKVEVVGVSDPHCLIIKLGDKLHSINGNYLAEMQKKDFSSIVYSTVNKETEEPAPVTGISPVEVSSFVMVQSSLF